MLQEKIILGIIPARGGSKRIPKKNIKLLGGKPLIAYTIESAVKSRALNDFIVSTDNQDIHDVAEKFGARVMERPKVLATDWAKTIDVILDILRKEEADIVVCLQPTSPFRTAEDIDNAIRLFLNSNCESVISVCEVGQKHTWFMKMKGQHMIPVFGHKYLNGKANLPKMFIPNGAIYISTTKFLKQYKSFYTNKVMPYIMPIERSLDVDDPEDLLKAQLILRKNL